MIENDAQNSPNRGDDIIVPEISENDARNQSLSPRGGIIISGLILIQTTQKTSGTKELNSSRKREFFSFSFYFFLAPLPFFE